MADLEQTIDIDAPPERVWAILNDLDRLGEWVEEHRGFPEGAPDRLAEGTRYTQSLAAAGQEADVEWTVVEHDEPRVLAFDGDGPAGSEATMRYELEPTDGGTRVAYATSFDLPGGPLGSVVSSAVSPGEDDARRTLERLKAVAERWGGGVGAPTRARSG